MRMMMTVSMPVEPANKAIKDGILPKILKKVMDDIKPEAAYFTTSCGKRTGYIFFDLKDPTQIPSIAEPLFMGLNAGVDWKPVMNAADLAVGIEKAMKNM